MHQLYYIPRNSGKIDIKFLQLDDRDTENSRIDYMNHKIESISTKEGKNALNIIMIDEMCPSPNDTDRKVVHSPSIAKDVDYVRSIQPHGGFYFKIDQLDCNYTSVLLKVLLNFTGGREHDWSDLKCNQENVFLLVAFNPCNSNEKRGVY